MPPTTGIGSTTTVVQIYTMSGHLGSGFFVLSTAPSDMLESQMLGHFRTGFDVNDDCWRQKWFWSILLNNSLSWERRYLYALVDVLSMLNYITSRPAHLRRKKPISHMEPDAAQMSQIAWMPRMGRCTILSLIRHHATSMWLDIRNILSNT